MNTIVYQNGRTIKFEVISDHSEKVRFNVELGNVKEILDDYVELDFDPTNCSCKQFGILCELVATVE